MCFDKALIVLIGLTLGSFIYTTALRLRDGHSLLGRSRCDYCQTPVAIMGLTPILGFVFYKGKCRSCGGKISPTYPLSEVFNALLVYLIHSKLGWSKEFFHILIIFEVLWLTAIIDLNCRLIFPQPVFICLAFQGAWLFFSDQSSATDSLTGLFVGTGVFHWISYVYENLRGKTGLGEGDAILLGLIGFCFGPYFLFPVVFWASVFGVAGGGGYLLLRRHSLSSEIAFAPWLALAAFLSWRFPAFFWSPLFLHP